MMLGRAERWEAAGREGEWGVGVWGGIGRWLDVDMRLDMILLLLGVALIPHHGCIIDFSNFIYTFMKKGCRG